MQLPLDRLIFPPNMPAGMDWAVIGLWVCQFRKTPQPCNPPIVVEFAGKLGVFGEMWLIKDGRHRTVASLIAGRTHIEAEEAQTPP